MHQNELLCRLCANLKLIRSLHNLTQDAFAKKLHLSRSTYAAYERGSMLPSIITLKKIADFHNLKIDDLISNELSIETLKSVVKP